MRVRRYARPLPLTGGGAFFCAALLAASAPAGDLRFPVDCTLGRDCFIQQYVDRDPGPDAVDFTCGTLAYEGHKGTDFRLADDAAMGAGVDVLAAAPGRIRAVRDGMPDVPSRAEVRNVDGRECGNGVLIERADGWTLQYCHMRQGSVRVAQNQTVAAGDVLGQIGLSGATQFPHLHLTIRDAEGRIVDPFDARPQAEPCTLPDDRTLWAEPLVYRPGGVLAAGFLDRLPDYGEVKDGRASRRKLPAKAPAMVFWTHFYGLRKGDSLELSLSAPDGSVLVEATHEMPRNRATEYRAVGRKANGAWPAGSYLATAVLRRGGEEIDRFEGTLTVN